MSDQPTATVEVEMFGRTDRLVERMEARGTVPFGTRPLHRFIGAAIGVRNEVLSVLHLFDKPDETWEDAAINRICTAASSDMPFSAATIASTSSAPVSPVGSTTASASNDTDPAGPAACPAHRPADAHPSPATIITPPSAISSKSNICTNRISS